ncbi:MAG: hypothetical protein AAFU83_01650 [Bacteroidota bacterium]
MVSVRALPRHRGDEIQADGVCTLTEPASYEQPSLKGVGTGSSLTPFLTGNVSQGNVDWDYNVPVRLQKRSKEEVLSEMVEKNKKEVEDGTAEAVGDRVLDV